MKNKEPTSNKRGRPPLYKTPEELQKLIDGYFKDCEKRDKPPTIAGLAYTLGIDRQTVYNYGQKEEFFGTIKKARDRIIVELEERLMTEGKSGQIFLAKNYGYTDKQEHEVTGKDGGPIEINETRKNALERLNKIRETK